MTCPAPKLVVQPESWSVAFRKRGATGLALIVFLSVLVRGVFLAPVVVSGKLDDPDNYLPLARSLAEGRGFVLNGRATAYRPPLYPMVLAPIVAVIGDRTAWGLAALHLVLGATSVVLTAAAARSWGLSKGRVAFAAVVVAFDPVLVSQSKAVMTETLAACLSAAAMFALTIPGLRGVVSGGVMFGLGALCRPTALPVACLSAFALLAGRESTSRDRLVRAGALLGVTALTLAPWALRNLDVLGSPIFTTTHGGYTLALANNAVYYDEVVNGPPGAVWTGRNQWFWWNSVNRRTAGLPEPAADRMLRDDALRVIRQRPGDFFRATLARLGRFWGVAPAGAVYPRWLRIGIACWTSPLWLALVAGLCSRGVWKWPRSAAPATLLALTLVHGVYWTDMRMRAAAVPAIALIAACATTSTRRDSGA